MVKPCSASGLSAWDQVNCYCERALNPDFWAEPLNALSNLAFLLAAAFVYTDLRASGMRRGKRVILALVLLLILVGVGSFLFHTFATQWSRFADIVPIAVFVAAYMTLALNWFLELRLWAAMAISGAVVLVTVFMFLAGAALNGSIAYAPALVALVLVGIVLHGRKHGATDWILSAFCVFTVSLTLRTIDGWPESQPIGCMVRELGERSIAIGTHPLWHILNAVTLYLLLRAAIENPPAPRKSQ